jgi:predicted AlkP superfamily pyrophosphatase or phosphodiesterase
MNKSLFLLTLSLALTTLHAAQKDRHVILVSVDGLASHYFDDPKAHMPTIRALAAKGARAKRMKCSFPSVTWPNHTTLVTGVEPGRHGVIANNYYDRKTRKSVPFIPDPLFDKHEIVKVPTVYDVAHQAGLKTAGVIWPATRNAATLDWQLPDVFDQKIFEDSATPSLLRELKAKGIPYEKQMEWCKAGNAGKAQRDWMYTRIAEHLLTTHKPNFLAIHLVTVDSFEHSTGRNSPEVYWACNDSDNRVREIIEATKTAGIYENTTFVIAADHGFITYTNQIKPNVVLKKRGLLKSAGPRIVEQKAYCLAQGGAAMIYILDQANRAAIAKQLRDEFAGLEGVAAVIEPKDFASVGQLTPDQDPRSPDLFLSAKNGYSFSGSANGDSPITAMAGPRGSHGYLPTHPLMYAGFVISGAGIKQGVVLDEISNMDVAPTIASLLGVKMKNVDGRVLREILVK